MRTIVVLAAAVTLLALAAGAAARTDAAPTIRIFDLIPAKARGAHFGAREQVKVTLWAGTTKRVRTTRASVRGSFVVDFGALADKDRCSGQVSVAAVGARGHRASYKLPALACPTITAGGGER
jgi:hypothetical protein